MHRPFAARTLTALTAWSQRQVIVGEADGRTAAALLISSEYFHLPGQTPRIGRPFLPLDFQQHDVAIISDRLWRERFNGDPMIVGRRLAIDVKPDGPPVGVTRALLLLPGGLQCYSSCFIVHSESLISASYSSAEIDRLA